MSAVAVKGWCPGALRPMRSGDGLVVRIRPRAGRLDAAQAAGIAELAARYGNGLIDLTSRANLQIRGVSDEGYPPLVDGLAELGLLDADSNAEAQRNILVTPFWTAADETRSLATELEQGLASASLDLPTKFGFAIDDGNARMLAGASADIRIERDRSGGLLVRADGAQRGLSVRRSEVVQAALALAEWFVASGGVRGEKRRMAAHLAGGASVPETLCGDAEPLVRSADPAPGLYPAGAMVGVVFGQMPHQALGDLAGCAQALRMTPWRMMLVEGMREMPGGVDLVTDAGDPRLRVVACSGAPRCGEAHADTRVLASALTRHIPPDARLHVSGCAKGCAHSGSADVTLVATDDGFDLIRRGTTRDAPVIRGLTSSYLVANPSVLTGGH
ncbi:precorrin-3B synthase [Bradyrhizobium elkanii]|uniref:Precorrin-3B synthase n=1 Tax=Bradyrhizobium elkanii TaxID=29448 RepID=A0ABV4EXA9_BRAEL|nr:precorrin-3B synthase [Bradyrhizobium elkanii]MCP1756773.1 precorrin-3B synthase [Bradyrhizobium elkanii]MCP1982286.1 precorrin-3B synthase [Bradyrhizobium elkanii]MCS3882930.1 precorrin-3B synthase [Bradyrhizobium elkanii]MCS4218013.1 precorrin-3B synthase [Bradyrhizobium elkanii]MCW2195537.1 precorrin-3B synthase [Bradyrhizobium elkanii]